MKSTTDSNVKSQIRRGISQLYEYRYIENKPDASLVLVIENPLQADNNWLQDYMETDRIFIYSGMVTTIFTGQKGQELNLNFWAYNHKAAHTLPGHTCSPHQSQSISVLSECNRIMTSMKNAPPHD